MGKRKTIKGTKGDDHLNGTEGKDKIISGKGDDTINAGGGHDYVNAGKGDDVVNAGTGNDYVVAGKGDDTVTGGAGDDCIHLGKGNDTAIYVLGDNTDSEDFYHGGKGNDTLRLEFTKDEWLREDVQADIAAYLAFLNGDDVPDEYWHNRSTFEFKAFNLTAKQFENLEVVVDGQELNPADEAVEALNDELAVAENSTISGNVLDNDDVPDLVKSVELIDNVTKGILTFNPDGTFEYDTNGDFETLAVGETATQTFTYKVIDADGDEDTATVTLTITGENDASVVAGSFTGMVTEGDVGDPAETAMGALTISDVDSDDNPSFADQGSTVGDNGYGSFVLASGVWTYTLDQSAVQDLDAGDSVDDSITYTATDGTTQQIVVTIEGTDDASVVAGSFTGMVTEGDVGDPAETAMGALTISDVDGDDNPSFADQGSTVGDNGYGSFVLASGVWTYTLDQSAVQDLDAGDSVDDSITYTATDGTTQQIVVTIEGTDDASVVAGSFTGMVTEGDVGDPAETAMGALTISDVDSDDNPSFADQGSTVGDNGYGSFVLASGVWTYTLDQSAVQDLDAGDSVDDSITYTATDGTTQQIVVTIEGTDDASVVAGSFTGMVTEGDVGDPAETAMGALTISDVDGDDNPSFADQGSTVGDNGYGSFVLASGVWTYTLDQSAVQDLDAGDSVDDSITYTATDGTTQQIVVTIEGTDDASVVAGSFTGMVTEGDVGDPAETAMGALTISDVDGDDNPSFADQGSTVGDNGYGSFVLASGVWTYTLDQSAVQDLDAGDSVDDSITYTATDGTTQQIVVTIEGTDDASVVAGSFTGMVTEGDVGDPAETAMGALTISDVDSDDNPSFADQGSTVGDNGYGSFVLASGVWTYTLDQSAVQDLDAGDSVDDSITYTATDGTTQQIVVTIEGTDDASVVAGSFTGMVTEGDVGDPAETAMGALTISDVDGDDNPSFADQGSTVGDNGYGSFVLASGVWTYTLDQSAVQDLDAGDSVDDSITYTATDGTTQQIVVTIEGTDDGGFEGKQLTYQYLFPTQTSEFSGAFSFAVGSGVEVIAANTTSYYAFGFNVDVMDTSIVITYVNNINWNQSAFNGFKLSDLTNNVMDIIGVSDNSTKAVTTFSNNEVFVNWQGQSFGIGESIIIDVIFGSTGIDPIILDLGDEGFHLSASANFDINADGQIETIAWSSGEDGILAVDLDGSGMIEDGSEIFTPDFGEGGHASAMAALQSLDSNGDGQISVDDESYDDFIIWIDANSDGVSQAEEMTSLSEQEITSINLTTEDVDYQIDGQQVLADGSFTLENGNVRDYIAVALDFVEQNDQIIQDDLNIQDDGAETGQNFVEQNQGAEANDPVTLDTVIIDDFIIA